MRIWNELNFNAVLCRKKDLNYQKKVLKCNYKLQKKVVGSILFLILFFFISFRIKLNNCNKNVIKFEVLFFAFAVY